jgi:hypothetical protein
MIKIAQSKLPKYTLIIENLPLQNGFRHSMRAYDYGHFV